MSYRLDPAMPMSEALRRVAFGELEIAHGALASPPDRHGGVHDARTEGTFASVPQKTDVARRQSLLSLSPIFLARAD